MHERSQKFLVARGNKQRTIETVTKEITCCQGQQIDVVIIATTKNYGYYGKTKKKLVNIPKNNDLIRFSKCGMI